MKKLSNIFKCLFILSIFFIMTSCGSNNTLTTSVGRLSGEHIPSNPIKNAEYKTEYNAAVKNRTHNLLLSVEAVDNTIIMPYEIFSFNEAVGKTTKERGYKPAKIFVKGKEEEGLGGGICQLSSTLYNAADRAGLNIIERHAHSKEVHYVPKGRDAATSYGSIDLKFQNTFHYPIKIVAKAADGVLIVRLERVA